ncbi:MAG: AbrB/MazE/SpoVT family DNA-binding domain-containing protein [Candidatus Aenigmatarchaeota archaeon]|nr:MAG: AbrB/MazE/SpoVT family DNA-binding domain-containing protein [Candidatus Aenigmarchaeota archaeon]
MFKSHKLKFIDVAKVSRNKMVFLPKEVREILNIDSGSYVGFYQNSKGDVVIKKMEIGK